MLQFDVSIKSLAAQRAEICRFFKRHLTWNTLYIHLRVSSLSIYVYLLYPSVCYLYKLQLSLWLPILYFSRYLSHCLFSACVRVCLYPVLSVFFVYIRRSLSDAVFLSTSVNLYVGLSAGSRLSVRFWLSLTRTASVTVVPSCRPVPSSRPVFPSSFETFPLLPLSLTLPLFCQVLYIDPPTNNEWRQDIGASEEVLCITHSHESCL